jgi:hypothetical protein
MDTSPITIGVGNGAVLRLLLLPSAQRVAPPAQNQPPRARQAEFVICDQTIETPQREMWGKALTVLQEFAHLPEPEGLELMHRVRARK